MAKGRNTQTAPKTLREARLAENKTLEEVAEAVDTDVGNLSRIERGIQVPTRDLARRLFDHFGGAVDLASIYDPAHRQAS